MSNEVFEKFTEASKSNYESAKALYDINVKTLSQLAEQQVAYSKLCMETMSASMSSMTSSKDIKEAATAQTELYQSMAEKVQGIARNSMDILTESKDEVTAWVEKSVEEVSAKMKAA